VSSYRPSIITFPLYLCVSEILPLLCSSTSLFPAPPLVSSNFEISPCSSGSRWMTFGLRRAKVLGITLHFMCSFYDTSVQLVSKISNLCDPGPPTLQTEGRTDGQTYDMQSQDRALHYRASRGKKAMLIAETKLKTTKSHVKQFCFKVSPERCQWRNRC